MRDIISTLHSCLINKEISSVELTKQYINAIERDNTVLNAYVHTTFEDALKQAEMADKLIADGNSNALCGISMTLKDNICTDGQLTTCCSKMLSGFRPYYDSTAWSKLKAQGAVLLGKTNMDEFAMGNSSETSVYGAPKNPRNINYVTGGSSGGGASAVCGNLAAYAIGSDTGGSVRQPASYCGIVGLKPTYGAVSRYGLIAYASSLDQIGVLASGVMDAAIVFDAIKGLDSHDQTSVNINDGLVSSMIGNDIKGLKIGVAREFFDDINPEVKASVENAIKFFEAEGATIIDISIPTLKQALSTYYIIACAEASSNLGRYDGIRYGYRAEKYDDINDMILKSRSEGFGSEVKRRIMLGTYVLSSGYYDAYYKKACLIRKQIVAQISDVFKTCDILISPTAPNTAFPLGYKGATATELYQSDICTVPVNITGVPAISIPCGVDSKGLPIGMQLIGNKFDEVTILNAAYYYQQNSGVEIDEYEGGVRI